MKRVRRAAVTGLAGLLFVVMPVAGGPAESVAKPVGATARLVHEVPADVAVQAYVRPAGSTLTLLVRVPFESMRDIAFPLLADGTLDLASSELGGLLDEAATLWIAGYLELYADGRPLGDERVVATRLSLPSDRSFTSFEQAEAHIAADPLPESTRLRPAQTLFDVRLEVPIIDASARFALDPALAHLGIETVSVVHFVPPDGGERVFRYEGNPGRVELDPSWFNAFWRFVELGFVHILGGLDHLLFIICLVIPFRRVRGLIPVVTAFTIAHSITLLASAFGLAPSVLWFAPLIETLIAASIVWMALENIVGAGLSRRWIMAFAFGLVHGFGFSFVLGESLQFAGRHLVSSLLAFNVGVELGQIAVLLVAVPVLNVFFRRVVSERVGVVVLSALVAHVAWHWMTARGAALLQYDVRVPALDAAFLADALRWAAVLLGAAGAAWGLSRAFGPGRGFDADLGAEAAPVVAGEP